MNKTRLLDSYMWRKTEQMRGIGEFPGVMELNLPPFFLSFFPLHFTSSALIGYSPGTQRLQKYCMCLTVQCVFSVCLHGREVIRGADVGVWRGMKSDRLHTPNLTWDIQTLRKSEVEKKMRVNVMSAFCGVTLSWCERCVKEKPGIGKSSYGNEGMGKNQEGGKSANRGGGTH